MYILDQKYQIRERKKKKNKISVRIIGRSCTHGCKSRVVHCERDY